MRKNSWFWFGVLAGPVIGILYLSIGYGLVTLTCVVGFSGFALGPLSGLQVLVLLLGLLCGLILIAGAVHAYRFLQQASGEATAGPLRKERDQFLAFTGLVFSCFSLLFIVLATIPAMALNPCP